MGAMKPLTQLPMLGPAGRRVRIGAGLVIVVGGHPLPAARCVVGLHGPDCYLEDAVGLELVYVVVATGDHIVCVPVDFQFECHVGEVWHKGAGQFQPIRATTARANHIALQPS